MEELEIEEETQYKFFLDDIEVIFKDSVWSLEYDEESIIILEDLDNDIKFEPVMIAGVEILSQEQFGELKNLLQEEKYDG